MNILQISLAAFFCILTLALIGENVYLADKLAQIEDNEILSPQPKQNPEIFKNSPDPSTFIESFTTPVPNILGINNDKNVFENLIYPQANVVSKSEDILYLESFEETEKITSWYKETLNNMDIKIKNVVQTNANNNIVNKLGGLNDLQEIYVDISKQSSNPRVKILVRTKSLNPQKI